jgi:hypothetical protein
MILQLKHLLIHGPSFDCKRRENKNLFDGWPTIIFSGWPDMSYGTFEVEL